MSLHVPKPISTNYRPDSLGTVLEKDDLYLKIYSQENGYPRRVVLHTLVSKVDASYSNGSVDWSCGYSLSAQ